MTSTLINEIDTRLRAGVRSILKKKTTVAAIDAGTRTTQVALVGSRGGRPIIHKLIDERGKASAATAALARERADMRVCGISGHEVRTYLMNFPPMPAGELEILVRRNIARNIHSNPVVALETRRGPDGKVEVLAVASSGDLVSSAFEDLASRGISVDAAHADVMALAECIKAGYPEVKNRATCIFNMGATWSELVLMDKGRLVFSRSIRMGLSNLTETIADLCSIPVEKAQELIFSTGTAVTLEEIDDDDLMGRSYAESVRDVIEQLVVEVHRSLSFASLRHGLPTPDVVLLCGGASQVPGLARVLSREIGAPVEVFDPLDHMQRGDDVDSGLNGSLFCVAIGLGLLALRHGSPALLPAGLTRKSAVESRIPTALALAVVALLAIFVSGRVLKSSAEQYARAVSAENMVLESIGEWLAADDAGVDPEVQTRTYAFSLLNEPAPVWEDVLMELTNVVPEGIVLTQVAFSRVDMSPGEYSEWSLLASGVVADMDNTAILLKQMGEAMETSRLFSQVEVLPEGTATITYEGKELAGVIRFEIEAILE
jgi:Tfp pilus assembly PilM family ATPase